MSSDQKENEERTFLDGELLGVSPYEYCPV